jgi:hypothetical protein
VTSRQLAALFEEHGGIKSVHVHPATCRRTNQRGWAVTCICKDGFRRQLTKRETEQYATYKPVQQ